MKELIKLMEQFLNVKIVANYLGHIKVFYLIFAAEQLYIGYILQSFR